MVPKVMKCSCQEVKLPAPCNHRNSALNFIQCYKGNNGSMIIVLKAYECVSVCTFLQNNPRGRNRWGG